MYLITSLGQYSQARHRPTSRSRRKECSELLTILNSHWTILTILDSNWLTAKMLKHAGATDSVLSGLDCLSSPRNY